MELFGPCILLLVVAFCGIGVLLGWLAYVKVRKLETRLAALEGGRARTPAESATTSAGNAWASQPQSAPAPSTASVPNRSAATSDAGASSPPATISGADSTPSTSSAVDGARSTGASQQPEPTAPTSPAAASAPTDPTRQELAPGAQPPTPRADATPTDAERAPASRAAPTPAFGAGVTPTPAISAAASSAPPPGPALSSASTAGSQWSSPKPAPAVAPPAPSRPAFDLERWLGVRGAAVLGGVFLAIAGFLFLQHAIENQWITAKTRVIAATIAGVACFVGSFPLRKRGYAITASAIAGAGSVVLYAAAWAASMLYGFIEPMTAFGAMALVTAACIGLAWKHQSQLIAVLGLVGGFATPLVLSTGSDRPLGLFGYVLLLDLAFLFLAGKRRWPAIGFVALVGTTLLQGLWIFARMDPHEAWIGLAVLGLFALLFAFFAASRSGEQRRSWIPAQTGALFLPFAFVLYFAQDLALEVPLGALALLAALLTSAACVLARREKTPWLPIGAASGSVALLLVWAVAHEQVFDATTSLVLAGCALGITALAHVFAEWKSKDGTHAAGSVAGAGTSTLGMLLVATYAALGPGGAQPWPWIACFGVFALATQRQAALSGRDAIAFAGALGAGAALALQRGVALGALRVDHDVPIVLAVLAIGASLLVAARARAEAARTGAFLAAASFFVAAPFAFWSSQTGAETSAGATVLALAALLAIAVQALVAASGARAAAAFVVFALLVFLLQASEVGSSGVHEIARSTAWTGVLALLAATTALFGAWPFLARRSWRDSALAWRTAAFQPIAWIFPVAALVEARHGQALAFATPLVFAWGSAAQALASWRSPLPEDERTRRVQTIARVASTSVALLFLSSVVPVHVDVEPFALTMVLFGAALAVFWARVDSRATKWVSVASFTLAALALVFGRALDAFARPEHLLWNQHAYLFLLPATCAVVASLRLRSHEVERARGFEGGLYRSQKALAAGYVGLLAIAFAFVWISVEIASRYAGGDVFWLARSGEPGRPLAMSIGWALYALLLLALGIVRRAAGPRWVSLALFLVTIAKVFLFDLGHLEGLQRAASMLGLAVSLLVVSLVYQRFVFRRTKEPARADAPPGKE